MIQLVDRPTLTIGQGPKRSRWLAIVPPAELLSYIKTSAVRLGPPFQLDSSNTEILASYEEPRPASKAATGQSADHSTDWPPDLRAELERIDGMFKVIVASQPLEQWRLETVRAGYQNLLKRTSDRSDLEEALRSRLARVSQHEQAARAARTIESILAKSRLRDREVAQMHRDLALLEQSRARAYDAVGFIQPSARKVDGHKVFALIGGKGSTIAYLDLPPGLDPEPLLARQVGVRGQAHFSADLGTRLISVRDLESLEKKK